MEMPRNGVIKIPPEVIQMVNEQEIEKWSSIKQSISMPLYDSDPRWPIYQAIESYVQHLEQPR